MDTRKWLVLSAVLVMLAGSCWAGMMRFRVIDPFNPSAGEKKLLEENKEKIRTKNLGWKKF